MIPSEWISLGTAAAALAGPAITYGMLRQKVADLKEQISNLATKESVHTAEGRIADLETEMQEVRKLHTSVEVMRTEMAGFQKLYDRDAEEMKHGIRNIRAQVEALSYAPRRPQRAKPGTA